MFNKRVGGPFIATEKLSLVVKHTCTTLSIYYLLSSEDSIEHHLIALYSVAEYTSPMYATYIGDVFSATEYKAIIE